MNDNAVQISLATTKAMEVGGTTVGGGLGIYQLIVEHQEIIVTACAAGGFCIAILGYLTNTLLNWWFNYQHLKIARREASRRNDLPHKDHSKHEN